MKISRGIALSFLVFSAFNFAACGGSSPSSDNSGGASTAVPGAVVPTATTALYITQFSPAAGSYSALPNQIQVTLSETTVNQYSVQNIYNWTWSCSNGASYQVNSASFNASTGVVNVSVPPNFYLAQGTTCTLTASNAIVDLSNNLLSGTNTAAYTLSSGSSLPPGTVYVPQNNPPSYSQVVGSSSGTAFSENAASGYSLAGFQIHYGTQVNEISPVWAPNYGSTSSITEDINGGTYGTATGTASVISCPGANQRVVGIWGYAGSSVNALGVLCMAQDGSSSAMTYSSALGMTSGSSFELFCPAGTFVTSINGSSGSELNSLGVGCQ